MKDSEGLIVAVHPETQIVEPIVACVTAGLRAPGVRLGSGSPGNRSADGAPLVGGRTPVALGGNEAPALPDASSSASALDAVGDAEAASIEGVTPADEVPIAPVDPGATVTRATFNGAAVPGAVWVPEPPAIAERTTMATTRAMPVPTFARGGIPRRTVE